MTWKMFFLTLDLIVTGIFLAGCSNAVTLEPTATRAASASPVPPSATLAPSVTASTSPSATPTHTARPSHTATAQPTRTAGPPTLTPAPTVALVGRRTSKLAYASCVERGRFDACDIYVMNADGSDVIRLTNDKLWACCPVWSPDGAKIAYVRNSEIYVMNADGSNPIRLYDDGQSPVWSPAWSPDGTKIVFDAFGPDHPLYEEIYTMNADGSNLTRLTNNDWQDLWPAWSPDGSKIAFVASPKSNRGIYVMNAAGGDPIRLADTVLTPNLGPTFAWSPDSAKIAFSSHHDGNADIYVINADGSNLTNLTKNRLDDYSPAWSPDGAKIAFSSGRDYDWKIYVMNADGSNPIRLYDDGQSPVWSPDSSKIAFIESVKDYVYVMNADGSGLTYTTLWSSSLLSWLPTIATPSTSGPDCTSGWTRLTTGTLAQVSEASTASNRVRSGPSRGNDVIAQLPPGTVVKVLEGPVCTDGLVFWKVESDLIPGGGGWTAEGSGQGVEYYLEPYAP